MVDDGAQVVGEGANLGFTQAARIEYARVGGRINTDAIDNSAGVDCSDHEVNIKILLDQAVRDAAIPAEHRNPLLAAMTDDVARLVLRDNYEQNVALGNAASNAASNASAGCSTPSSVSRKAVHSSIGTAPAAL